MSLTYTDLPYTVYPDEVQSFVTMLNMTVADAPAVAGYQLAMQSGNTATAQQYYSQITSPDRKIVDSTKMNTLMQTCIALQRLFRNDIEPYVNGKQVQWENRINQFNYQGVYSAFTQYQINNFVLYDVNGVNRIYICTNVPPVGIPPTTPEYWRELSIQGLQGESGEGLSFRYAWDSSQIYYLDDVVTYNNSVWLCNQQNSNQVPAMSSPYWSLIYSPKQLVYPFQSAQPTSGIDVGYLWFQTV